MSVCVCERERERERELVDDAVEVRSLQCAPRLLALEVRSVRLDSTHAGVGAYTPDL